MAIELFIGTPETNQHVGQTVCVAGSYSGTELAAFDIICRAYNDDVGYDKELTATVNTYEQTWQATFAGLTPCSGKGEGSYTFAARVHPTIVGYQVSGIIVEVNANEEIEIGDVENTPFPAPSELTAGGREAVTVRISGTCRSSYTLEDGYTINARLMLNGREISEGGQLHRFSAGRWEYRFRTYTKRGEGTLQVEVWRVEGETVRNPIIVIARPHTT